MAAPPGLPVLYVEGKNDQHSIIHLLQSRGALPKSDDPKKPPPRIVEIKTSEPGENAESLIANLSEALMTASGRPTGFVVDANGDCEARWKSQILPKLVELGLQAGSTLPPEGLIARLSGTGSDVGVWIMPDNMRSGALESFLLTMIPDSQLRELAHSSTAQALAIAPQECFLPKDQEGAVVHCWLAWQREPGLPYGTGIRSNYFPAESDVADRFVSWFRRLYDGYLPPSL